MCEVLSSFPLFWLLQVDLLTLQYLRTDCGFLIRSTSSWVAYTSELGEGCNISMGTCFNQLPSWWFTPSLNQVQRAKKRLMIENIIDKNKNLPTWLSCCAFLHLQGQIFAFTWMEGVPRCARVNWGLPIAPACHAISYQLIEKVVCLPMLWTELQVIPFKL